MSDIEQASWSEYAPALIFFTGNSEVDVNRADLDFSNPANRKDQIVHTATLRALLTDALSRLDTDAGKGVE